jgi:hypothetical protein
MAATERGLTDPYVLITEEIKDPPRGWPAWLKYLGPGLILSASIVGSGELVATTALGMEAGFILVWMVVLSTLAKGAVQVEVGRWAMVTGQSSLAGYNLEGYNKVPPRIRRLEWVTVMWMPPRRCSSVPTGSAWAAQTCTTTSMAASEPTYVTRRLAAFSG